LPSSSTSGAPGNQGERVAGTHGIGVGTPSAAAVAAMTLGLAGLLHIPNEGMSRRGMTSKTVASGCSPVSTGFRGNIGIGTASLPKLHERTEPRLTSWGIVREVIGGREKVSSAKSRALVLAGETPDPATRMAGGRR